MATRKGRPVADAQTVLIGSKIPSGMVQPFVGTTAPAGFLSCDGSVVSRTTYSELFSVIGTSHGEGDGSTTFHLPDYRGRFLRGMDDGATRDPDAGTRTAPNTGGNVGDAIGSVQDGENKSHRHFSVDSGSTGGGVALNSGNSMVTAGSVSSNSGNYSLRAANTSEPTISRTSINGVGETRPTNINVNYIIKV